VASDSEILKTANLLVEQYGDMAPAGARIKADQLTANGDNKGRQVWLKIAKAAEDMLSEERPPSSVLH
jgi:hypothetical protein